VKVDGWVRELHAALLETGKMNGLTVEMLCLAAQGNPRANAAARWREIVVEVKGLCGKAGSIMGVLRKAFGRLEMDELKSGGAAWDPPKPHVPVRDEAEKAGEKKKWGEY